MLRYGFPGLDEGETVWPEVADFVPTSGGLPAERGADASGELSELPPAPSSLALGLTALAGLSLYQVRQALRRGQLAAPAEWYHTGGPQQIGHTTPFDPDRNDTQQLPACLFDEVVATVGVVPSYSRGPDRVLAGVLLALASAPRGPPVFSRF